MAPMYNLLITTDNVDLRKTGFLSPIIKKQLKKSNCCYAITATDGVLYEFNKIRNDDEGKSGVELSYQDIYDNMTINKVDDKRGKTLVNTYKWIKENGCVLERSCPYRGLFGPPAPERKVVFGIISHDIIPYTEMEEEIRNNGPVGVCVPWTAEMQKIKDEIYTSHPNSFVQSESNHVGSHFLLVVGFGSELIEGETVRYWLVRNSHGPEWGNMGYGRFNQLNVNGEFPMIMGGVVPRGISINHRPGELFKFD